MTSRGLPRRLACALLLAVASLAGIGCGSREGHEDAVIEPPAMSGRTGVTMGDDAFDAVALDTFEESACSPKLEDDFEGIRIAMPAKVSAGARDRVPLCGSWAFSNAALADFPMVEDSLVFLARNVTTHETATGNFRTHKDPVTADDMKAGAAENPPAQAPAHGEPVIGDEDITTVGYFNFNLGRVWDVPAKPGRWRVHVVLHGVQSNEVEFEVVK